MGYHFIYKYPDSIPSSSLMLAIGRMINDFATARPTVGLLRLHILRFDPYYNVPNNQISVSQQF